MWRDYARLHFIILLWGFTAIVGKWMSIDAISVVWYRTAIAGLGMYALLRWKRIIYALSGKQAWALLGTGGFVAAHWFLFFASARVSSASICLVGLASTALWTSILEPLLVRRPVRWYEIVLGAAMIASMGLISHFEPKYLFGLLLGVASALCASMFTILNGQFTKNQHHFVITFYEMLGAFALTTLGVGGLLLYGEPLHLWPQSTGNNGLIWATDLLNLFFLAVVCTIYAYSTSVEIMRRIPPFVVNLSVNLEPVYGILLAAVIFDEASTMTPEFYLSALVILVCVLLYPVLKRWDDGRVARRV